MRVKLSEDMVVRPGGLAWRFWLRGLRRSLLSSVALVGDLDEAEGAIRSFWRRAIEAAQHLQALNLGAPSPSFAQLGPVAAAVMGGAWQERLSPYQGRHRSTKPAMEGEKA